MIDVSHPEVWNAVERALAEDIGTGDVTSQLTVPEDLQAFGAFKAKQDLVLAGVELLPVIYSMRGGANIQSTHNSGEKISVGDTIANVSATARILLECERVALNFLQRLSGIATLTRAYVDRVSGTSAKVLDTRKTTPGMRKLEKMAVQAGGGTNHRAGLFDAVLIKNNHIAAAGGVRRAFQRAESFPGPKEIEVRSKSELHDALDCGARRLLLDNLTPLEAAAWIREINGRATVELSGGITLESIRAYAETGADFISCGALTHSATAVDISFQLELV